MSNISYTVKMNLEEKRQWSGNIHVRQFNPPIKEKDMNGM